MAKAPKPYSKEETAYQKALRRGSPAAHHARRKGYVAYASPEGQKRARKARESAAKYRNSKWAVADAIASELLIALTSAREVKKVLHGKGTKGDFARIAGNAATYAVPYGKLNKAVNAVVGGKAVKSAVSASKAKSAAKGSKKIATKAKAGAAGVGAAGRKTVRGAGKTAAVLGGATAADSMTRSGVNKILRNKKGR